MENMQWASIFVHFIISSHQTLKKKGCCCSANSTFNTRRRKRDVSLFMEEDLH